MADDKNPYSDYFDHNRTIVGVLSLFSGFLFTSITILINQLQNKNEMLPQATLLFLTILFYIALYVLLDNLEMGFGGKVLSNQLTPTPRTISLNSNAITYLPIQRTCTRSECVKGAR